MHRYYRSDKYIKALFGEHKWQFLQQDQNLKSIFYVS